MPPSPPPNHARPALPRRRWPILTLQPRVPWLWVALIQFPWFCNNVVEQLSRTMVTFTLQPYVSAPWLITLLTSFNVLFNLVVAAPCNYASDRVWTRWGRRRPFLIFGHLAAFVFLLVIPAVRGLWPLVFVFALYELLRDVHAPTEPLEKEVVPVPQRGRGQALTNVARTGGVLFFSAVLLTQFDARYELPGGGVLTGEQACYWAGAAFSLAMALFYLFCVRETPPPAPAVRRTRATPTTFVREVFGTRQNWAVYAVGAAMLVFWTSLGNLAPLLITEQFGYSKQDLGFIITSGQLFTLLVVLPASGWLADRFDRARLFQGAAAAMTLHHIAFYLYARHAGGEPAIVALVAFSMVGAAISNVGTVAAVSLQFDYVTANQMGTISAGIGIIRTIFELLVRNAIGVWVTCYSAWFQPDGRIDYLSGYHCLIVLGIGATATAIWFVRLTRSGRLVPHGRIEQQERMAAMETDAPS